MEASISNFLALAESSLSTEQDMAKFQISNRAGNGVIPEDLNGAESYIDFVKFKFNKKTQKNVPAEDNSAAVMDEWLRDYLLSNADANCSDASTMQELLAHRNSIQHTIEVETARHSHQDGDIATEEMIMASSKYVWRFEDKLLSKSNVKVDNFLINDNESSPSPSAFLPSTPLTSSSYIPSGMIIEESDDEDNDDHRADCNADMPLEDLDSDSDKDVHDSTDIQKETSSQSDEGEILIEHMVENEDENNTSNENEEVPESEDMFLASMIAFLRSTGSKNHSLANSLQALRYGISLPEPTASQELENDDNEVYEFE